MAKSGGYIEVTVRFYEEGDQWTAECVELGTATCADTLPEAQVAINEMVLLHLDALEDVGACEDFLKKHGVTFHKGSAKQKPGRRCEVRVRTGELAGRTRIAFPKRRSRTGREAVAL